MSQALEFLFVVIMLIILLDHLGTQKNVPRELPHNTELIDIMHFYRQPAKSSPQLKIFRYTPSREEDSYFRKTVLRLTISNSEDFEVYVGGSENEVEENYISENRFYAKKDLEEQFFDIPITIERPCVGIYTKESYYIERQFIDKTLRVLTSTVLFVVIYYILMQIFPVLRTLVVLCRVLYAAVFCIFIMGIGVAVMDFLMNKLS